jgi:hypothetical protein
MRQRSRRAAFALLVMGGVCMPVTAAGDALRPPMRATLVCESPPGPGRFRCDVELRVSDGTLSWAEVLVVETDEIVLPLRGRLGPRDASTHDADIFRWSLGFVAKARGAGKVTVRVRAVLCHGQTCVPVESDVSSRVVVPGAS